jgi:hypothetical protein
MLQQVFPLPTNSEMEHRMFLKMKWLIFYTLFYYIIKK